MKLRTKLLAAQVPLVVALLVTLAVGTLVTRDLGKGSENILKDNYGSVLAAEHMKEAAERIDSGVAFLMAGRAERGLAQIADNIARFEAELHAQEENITEPGEREATIKLRGAWNRYRTEIGDIQRVPETGLDERYFRPGGTLEMFLAVKDTADVILAMNQDAMIRKSDEAQRFSDNSRTWLVLAAIIGLVLASIATSMLMARTLRPLNVLAQTTRRLGEGDVAVRARVDSGDEIGALAKEINTMAGRIQRYRESSLGELLEAQLAAQATIDSLPDPVLVVALGGELRHANQAAATILKARADADNAIAQLAPAVRALVDTMRAHVAAGRGAYVPKGVDEAVRIVTADGERMFLPRAAPLYAQEGDVAGVTIVLQDVTRLRRFEELRNDLVATVAHELRTPLTSLRMAVHLLAEQNVGPLTGKQADLVFAAREECDRLQSIVDELLDLSRIQADRVELRIAAADPEALVTEAIEDQRSVAEARHVALRAEALPGLPAVQVDRERIQLVFANLLANAIRYGPDGGTVTVRARADGKRTRFEVADEGPGIPPEYLAAVFEKYVRVPGAPAGGSGIGLFIAREIVRAHGGDIGVDSTPRGTTFWFTVPT